MVADLNVVLLALEEHAGRRLKAKQAGHESVLHEHDHRNSIENSGFALHEEARMGFAEPDEGLEHANRLAVFTHPWTLPQKLVVGVQNGLCLLGHDRFENFLHKVDVLAQLFVVPGLLARQVFLLCAQLGTRVLQNVLCPKRVFCLVMTIDQNENQIESAQ